MKLCRALVLQNTTYYWQLLLIPSNIFVVSLALSAILHINSVTTNCLRTPKIATCKRSTLLALEMFKGNQEKTRLGVICWD